MDKQLVRAVEENNIDRAANLLETGASVNALDVFNEPLLTRVCRDQNKPMTELLLKGGAGVNEMCNRWTALMDIAVRGNEEITDLLLQHDADVMQKGTVGRTPVHWAAMCNHKTVLDRLLCCFGSIVDIEDDSGNTPLWWAADYGYEDCVGVLLSHGANPDHKSKTEGSPLDVARSHGHAAIVSMMEEALKRVADRLGPEGRAFYMQAARKGILKIPRAKIDAVGDEDAGKSCLADSIMDQPYIEERSSTKGVLMRVAMRTAVSQQGKWHEVKRDKFDEVLDQLLARGCATYSENPIAVALSSNAAKRQAITQRESVASVVASPVLKSNLVEGDGCEITIGLNEFMKILDWSEGKAAFIEGMRQNVERLHKYKQPVIINLMDRGGQELFLSIHAALMADSTANASGYLVVIDITKPLDEEVHVSKFRREEGGVMEQSREAKTRADTLRHWVAAVEAAHPHDAQSSCQFLGKSHGVKRPPAVFIVTTRKDQINHLSQEFIQKQEQLLVDVISESEHFADHLVPYHKDPYDALFRVDNTKYGKGQSDPVVVQLRDTIVQMTRAHCEEGEGTPLSYVMLEIGLNKVSRITSNQGKVLELENVFRLADQVCDLAPGLDCTTALRHLSNMGAICYYHEEPGLKKKVFPDPQWLANVMSTFVTILGRENVDFKLWHDLCQLHCKGLMTWKLAEYLLDKAKVDVSVQKPILLVLQLFNIISPALTSPQDARVKTGQNFFVPSMVTSKYTSTPLAYPSALQSSTAPPPLFLIPKGFTFFLKPLFYRVVSRMVAKYNREPELSQNQVILHLSTDLELEMFYTEKAVIVTVFAFDPDKPPSQQEYRQQCSTARMWLVEELTYAKRRGMDGFHFDLTVHPTVTSTIEQVPSKVDYNQLASLENYPTDKILLNKKGKRIHLPKQLALWYPMQPRSDEGIICSLDPNSVLRAVQRRGCDRWFSLSLEMGFCLGEVNCITCDIPNNADKLRAAFERKAREKGRRPAAALLLDACKRIPEPIFEDVLEDINRK